MKRTNVAASIAFCLISSTAVQADWQYTKWGMTVEEVSALPGVSQLSPERAAGYTTGDGLQNAKLHAPYQSGQFQFDAIFSFGRDGRLSAVRLVLMAGSENMLRDGLLAKYGRPTRTDFLGTIWDNGPDEIRLSTIGKTNVVYTPRISSNNSGL